MFWVRLVSVEAPRVTVQSLACGADFVVLLRFQIVFTVIVIFVFPLWPFYRSLDDALINHCISYFYEAADVCAVEVVDEVAVFTVLNTCSVDCFHYVV